MLPHASPVRTAPVRLALVVLCVLTVAAVTSAQASAKTKIQTVKAEMVFATGQNPANPGNCSAVVFLKWPDVKNAVGWKGFYTYQGKEKTQVMSPPFDDTYKWVATYTVTPGSHWFAFPPTWRSGSVPSDCSDFSVKQRAVYGTEAHVEVTVQIDEAACTAARSTAARRLAAVNKLKARVAKATGAEKKRLKRALTAAKASRAKAVEKVAAVC